MPKNRFQPYKDLNFQQLRGFLAVRRLESFARAATELGLATPTVWEQIHALERHYGLPLFERQGNRMVATAEGDKLFEMIQPLLAGLDSVKEVLNEQRGALPECLTVLSGPRILLEDMLEPMARFQRAHPSIRLRVLHTGGEDLDPLVERGEVDLALTLEPGPRVPPAPAVEHEHAYEMDYLLVAPPRHPLARCRRLRLEDIAQFPLIVGRPEAYARHRLEEVFYRVGLSKSLRIAVETSSDAFSLGCVQAGMGVAIIAGNPRGLLCRGLWLRSLREWFGTARFTFVWKRGALLRPSVRELAEVIRSYIADKPTHGRRSHAT
jgi:DNA-binding transcriptional LysR family regulator